ncbi:MAG: RagB/SusD family nutrient uptake outer membrane protein [Dysgonamonadaceae bacterium]|jgi:tetratricopeptide (TPR) repeat protein|nr:RagB/SusD family nutrient uptake outer membrane protein [Dysgonamonadaceae bacterium]
MKNYISLLLTALLALSCNDFLNELPDNRTQLDTQGKIKELLITAYPAANYALIAEFSSDNIIDNQAPVANTSYPAGAFDRMDTDIFEWKEDITGAEEDSPYYLWSEYYQSIASANHALKAIEKLEQEGAQENMNPQKGEALLIRAYSHFMLVNIFAKTFKDAEKSATDPGIPYVTEPVNTVQPLYERNSVAKVYELIANDIEAGIDLIDDHAYAAATAQYHFNTNAAHAFASQFYLYKRDYEKVIFHADRVLGAGNPSPLLRNWYIIHNNFETEANAYVDAENPANLLIIPTTSIYSRRFFETRYGWKGPITEGNDEAGPNWSGRHLFVSGWSGSGGNYGYIEAKINEYFEYTDKVAEIGYAHVMRTEFTTDDALLNRAEAKIMLNRMDDAVKDLEYWTASHTATQPLTKEKITNFYRAGRAGFVFRFHTEELSPDFIVAAAQKPFVDCVLHFRRLERVLEGHRWFDLKRYGIEITHVAGASSQKITLTYDDDRRAIQIPRDVIGAGLAPNPREQEAPKPLAIVRPAQRI